ncbi:MAG: DUF551 domain-containing protein [Acidobacteriia bacterium]|nr:DUF551 domain-containing protein [Terriglobia bacterium]
MTVWRPIADTPPSNVVLLVYEEVWGRPTLGVFRDEPYHGRGKSGWRIAQHPADRWSILPKHFTPSHWMPLPRAPTKDGGK